MSVAIGIDLGTTNTVVGSIQDGEPATLADPQGRRLLPSTVSFHPSGKVLVGHSASGRRLVDPENTVHSVKRLIGRGWPSAEVQAAVPRYAFRMQEGPRQATTILARGEQYSLPEISAFVLRAAKAIAETALGQPVERAVITVPASFNDPQRAATKLAGELAGLDVLRILNEPTAAALAYGEEVSDGRRERIAVYDLGGGTFDVTLLELSGSVFEVLSTAGDTSLGGDDIDDLIAARMAADILQKTRYDVSSHGQAFGQLRLFAEYMKRELTSQHEFVASSSDVTAGAVGRPIPFRYRMTRGDLESLILPLLDRTLEVCGNAIERAGLDFDQVDRVVLVGGSTRIPLVARLVERFFHQQPLLLVNPEEAVALGAAIQADSLTGGTRRRRGPASSSRIEVMKAPCFGPEPEDEPLEVVDDAGPSAAVEAPLARAPIREGVPLVEGRTDTSPAGLRVMSRPPRPEGSKPPLLIDVTPLTLSIETAGGYADAVIAANTVVPCDNTRVFMTASDNQTTVILRVAQGGSRTFAENTLLGELELSGLTPAPRGATRVAVTFVIDADGILSVFAEDCETLRAASARMRPFGVQTEPEDILAMHERQARHALG